MSTKRLALAFVLSSLVVGCALSGPSGPQTFTGEGFSFQYPENWQTMAELWEERYQPGKDYYQLGVTEIITVTSAQEQGGSGIWFAVASAPLPGGLDLEACYRQIYAPYLSEFRDFTEQPVTVNGLEGFEIRYSRPWGEPWWQFRDVWLESGGMIYLLSFHAGTLEPYQAEADFILESFALE